MKLQFPLSFLRRSGLIAGLGVMFILSACSSTTRTYHPYGTTTYSSVITPPSWAPSSENLTNVRYYYLPDCGSYYDASTQQFYSQSNGAWISTSSVPPSCTGIDLSNAYTVLLNSTVSQPWLNNSFYQTNYPVHSYDQYGNIVLSNNLISDLPIGYAVAPRGFNENTNSVIFLERAPSGTSYVLRDVPMSSIATYMPSETHIYYYGGGYRSR